MSDFGLMFYNARWYDPALGRFAQADSIIPVDTQGVQAWDHYAYTSNNPLRYTDPTGHRNCEEDGYNCPGDAKAPKVYGPPKPSHGVMHISFQMFQNTDPYYYGESANESFTDFPGGGDPQYAPEIYGARNNRVSSANPADRAGLVNDFLLGVRPAYLKHNTPYDQDIYLQYVTTYQNTPSLNATSTTTLTNLTVQNNATTIPSVIHYTISVDQQVDITTSAAPGQTQEINMPLNLDVHAGGLDITIVAFTGCTGTCIRNPNALTFTGNISFNFNP